MPAPEQQVQINEVARDNVPVARIHVPITYSSTETEPSTLSLLAYDAACYVAAQDNADLIVIAGEQSWSANSTTTGEHLVRLTPVDVPSKVIALRNDQNRLLNTARQAIELAQVIPKGPQVAITAWQFHEGRVEDNLANNGAQFDRHYVSANIIIDMLWKTAGLWDGNHDKKENAWQDRYGFEVDWPTVRDNGIQAFADRELGRSMQIAHRMSRSGGVFQALSTLRRVGRLDDLEPQGSAIMQTTR